MTGLSLLRAARALITDESAWTQGSYARDADNFECEPHWERARCWCALGAVCHAAGSLDWGPGVPLTVAVDALGFAVNDSIIIWNDLPCRTHAEVLDAFDRAIASLEKP